MQETIYDSNGRPIATLEYNSQSDKERAYALLREAVENTENLYDAMLYIVERQREEDHHD